VNYIYFALDQTDDANKAIYNAGQFRVILSNLDATKDVDLFVGNSARGAPTSTSYDFASISSYAEIVDVSSSTTPPFDHKNCAQHFFSPMHACVPSNPSPPPPAQGISASRPTRGVRTPSRSSWSRWARRDRKSVV
jgi:hypothetical protein